MGIQGALIPGEFWRRSVRLADGRAVRKPPATIPQKSGAPGRIRTRVHALRRRWPVHSSHRSFGDGGRNLTCVARVAAARLRHSATPSYWAGKWGAIAVGSEPRAAPNFLLWIGRTDRDGTRGFLLSEAGAPSTPSLNWSGCGVPPTVLRVPSAGLFWHELHPVRARCD